MTEYSLPYILERMYQNQFALEAAVMELALQEAQDKADVGDNAGRLVGSPVFLTCNPGDCQSAMQPKYERPYFHQTVNVPIEQLVPGFRIGVMNCLTVPTKTRYVRCWNRKSKRNCSTTQTQ